MPAFKSIELGPEEKMVFGPLTSTKSFSVGGAPGQQLTQVSGRTVGVTSQRVVIEDLQDPAKNQVVSNDQVQRVYVTAGQRQGQPFLTLERVETASGQPLKLDLKGLPPGAEVAMKELFPNAAVIQGKGGSKGGKVALIVVGAIVFLGCILPVLVLLILRLFNK